MESFITLMLVGAAIAQSTGAGGIALMGEAQTGIFGSGGATGVPDLSVSGIFGMLSPVLGMSEDTTGGSGPMKSAWAAVPDLPKHTVYMPKTVPEGTKLPVIVWGNGACSGNGAWFSKFLNEIASHGYLIVGSYTSS